MCLGPRNLGIRPWGGFANSSARLRYKYFGLNANSDNSIGCREWVPNANHVSLIGDFNNWDHTANPLLFEGIAVYCEGGEL